MLAALGGGGVAGCDGSGSDGATAPVDRETFVDVMVALRTAAEPGDGARSPDAVEPAARDSILERHGVSEEDLLEYARIHGGRPDEMARVWEEVQRRLDSFRAEPDEGATDEGGEPGPGDDAPSREEGAGGADGG